MARPPKLDPANYVKNILARPTERDGQRKIGASNLSNACTRCLAEDMLGVDRPQGIYNMGAIVGTAIHEYLEHRNTDIDAKREMKVTLGDVEGYGTVKSTTDLYLPAFRTVVDFKTTTRDKLKVFQRVAVEPPTDFDTDQVRGSRATLERYYRQAQSYGSGVLRAGYPVEWVAIVFIARDGQILDRDIWSPPPVPYDPKAAARYLERVRKIWAYLEGGGKTDVLTSDDNCYYCTVVRSTVVEEVEL